jgi:D-alanyl-D-alanine carboxypeptidase (penicillin-binding protein 5/6)
MSVQANAALLVDLDTDYIMYEQNAYERVYPASITKVMTALLVLEAVDQGKLSLDQVITAGDTAWQGLDTTSSNQNIKVGEEMTVKDLLYCLMVASANEAANILAVEVAGSIDDFVTMMNDKAFALGCSDTHFANPHGMPDDNHYTTAYDLYLIAKCAMANETFRTIVNTAEYYVEPTNMTETQRHFYNTNGLLSNKKYQGYYYEYATGIKTGSTDAAGYCLLSSAEKDGQRLICVMMGCENPKDEAGNVQRLQFSESARLFQWGFANFSFHTILDATDPVAEVPVTLSSECDYVSVIIDGTLEAQLPNDITEKDFQWTTDLPESVEAPVQAGDKLGTLTVTLDGEVYGTVDLVAVNSVERSDLLAFRQKVDETIHSWQFILAVVLILVIILAIAIRIKIVKSRRGRYGGRRSSGKQSNYRGKR